ncbi:GWxTD domain-containing protein [Gemmatimonas sp.]|uniref:GWxTD domain-containing protein n=1 Tax=Gemmatimonas sp. TaxID=1962908 RepID=UPI0035688D87
MDSLLAAARTLVQDGDTAAALTILARAQDRAPRNPEVLYQRGVLLARTTAIRLGDAPRNFVAWRLLDRAAEIDPGNARYLLEIGRIRLLTPLLRLEAERIMRKALRVADDEKDQALIAEISWEIGQIKERRYLTAKDRYLVTNAGLIFDADEAMLRRGYTREFLESNARPIANVGATDRTEAEEMYRRGLHAVPTHEPSALGLLGLLYDQRRFEEMRQVARPLLDAERGGSALRLAAGLAAYRVEDWASATVLFDSALDKMPSDERDAMTNLGRILRRRDAEAYESLSAPDRRLTDSAYWEAADPLLNTPANEARLEYLSRIAAAELRFSSNDLEQVGWRTDRGLILVRYGEPPVVATFAPTSAADAAETVGRITTVWYYPRNDRQFVFTGPPAMNYSTFAGPMRGLAEESRQDAPFLLDNVASLRAIDSIAVQLSRFRGNTDTTTQLVVAHAVDVRRLYGNVDLAEGSLQTTLYLGRPLAVRQRRRDTLTVALPAPPLLTNSWTQTVGVGPVRVRVEATDDNVAGANARAHLDLDIPRARRDTLAVSDAMITERATSQEDPRDGWQRAGLVPKGDLSIGQREAFSVYWETYGLRPSTDGRLKVKVQFRVTLLEIDRRNQQTAGRVLGEVADLIGLTKEGNEQLAVGFTREVPARTQAGTDDRLPLVNTIGLGTAPAGSYRLDVVVTDLVSGYSARTERLFRLARQ